MVKVNSHSCEFGYELISCIPYSYYLHTNGELEETISAKGSDAIYYFSPKHTINDKPRNYLNIKHVAEDGVPNSFIHQLNLNTKEFLIPPYKEHFKNDEYKFDKPTICICNRYNNEFGSDHPVNFFSLDCLNEMFTLLKNKYQIVYFGVDIPEQLQDQYHSLSLGDYEFCKTFHPEVIIFQDLAKDKDWNTEMLKVFANCERFITMNGGYSVLASFFGGQNIIYSKQGGKQTKEIPLGSFWRWYSEFSNSQICYTPSYDKLIEKINQLWVYDLPTVNILIRTCKRPRYFSDCIKSIQQQTYPNINIIVGIEEGDKNTFDYVWEHKVRIVYYTKETKQFLPDSNADYGRWFPMNNFLDILGSKVGNGWVIYIDDDDCFVDPQAVEKIVAQIKSNDDLILWRVQFACDVIIPNDEKWIELQNNDRPEVANISGIGFCFHSKWVKDIKWGFWKWGDFRVIKKLFSLSNSKKYINFVLTSIQDISNRGKLNDKQIEIIPNNNEKQVIMKILLLQTKYRGHYLGEIGEIMDVEQSTANALIAKGIAREAEKISEELEKVDKEAEEKKKDLLLKEAQENMTDEQLEESTQITYDENISDDLKESKDKIETKEFKTETKTKKPAGRPKKTK